MRDSGFGVWGFHVLGTSGFRASGLWGFFKGLGLMVVSLKPRERFRVSEPSPNAQAPGILRLKAAVECRAELPYFKNTCRTSSTNAEKPSISPAASSSHDPELALNPQALQIGLSSLGFKV